MIKFLTLLILTSIFALPSFAQEKPRFYDEVATIKSFDKIYKPPTNPILFIGSSSIRLWPNLQKTFCNHTVLNRGIGGAVVNDIIYYANDIIFPYNPKQIIIFVGGNDIVDKQSNGDSIFQRVKRLYYLIRDKLPTIPIGYIAIKPSPSREIFWDKAKQANLLIKNFFKTEPNTKFFDIYPLMLTGDGKPRPELFVKDMLHMNEKGYEIWEKAVRPFLIKD